MSPPQLFWSSDAPATMVACNPATMVAGLHAIVARQSCSVSFRPKAISIKWLFKFRINSRNNVKFLQFVTVCCFFFSPNSTQIGSPPTVSMLKRNERIQGRNIRFMWKMWNFHMCHKIIAYAFPWTKWFKKLIILKIRSLIHKLSRNKEW